MTRYEIEKNNYYRVVFANYYRIKRKTDQIHKSLSFEEKLFLLRKANGKYKKVGEPKKI